MLRNMIYSCTVDSKFLSTYNSRYWSALFCN